MACITATLGDALKQILQFLNLLLDDLHRCTLTIEEHYAYIVIYDQKSAQSECSAMQLI